MKASVTQIIYFLALERIRCASDENMNRLQDLEARFPAQADPALGLMRMFL